MSDGKSIFNAIKYLNSFYEQVSILLQTSDKLLAKYNWECIHGNTCYDDSSASVQGYNKWQPHYLFRFYMNNESNDIIFIAIILNDLNKEYKDFDEPIITACHIKSKKELEKDEIKGKYRYWWVKFYPWMYDDNDGKIFSEHNSEWGDDAENYPTIESLKIFANRLVDINNENDLDEMIIKKLIKIVDDENNK